LHVFKSAHKGEASAVGFAGDGTRLVSGGDDGIVRIWDTRTRSKVADLAGHTDIIEALAVSANGKTVASASRDRTVRLWDLATLQGVTLTHEHSVFGVAFAPHRPLLAVACSYASTALWDLVGVQKVQTLPQQLPATECITFLDDDWVAIGDGEGGITVW